MRLLSPIAMQRFALPVLLAATLAFTLSSVARQEPPKEKKKEQESELAERMERIEDLERALRKNLRAEGSRTEALAELTEIESLSLACKGLVPAAAAKLPEAERTAFANAYRRTMVDFLQRQLELEAALLDGDETAVRSAFERFRAMEDSSHERFAPEDD